VSVIVLEPVQHDHCAVLETAEVNDRAEVPRLEREDALRACPHYFRILRDVFQVTYNMRDIVCSLEREHTHRRQYRPESKKLLYSRTLCFNHMRLLLSHGSNETKLRQQLCYCYERERVGLPHLVLSSKSLRMASSDALTVALHFTHAYLPPKVSPPINFRNTWTTPSLRISCHPA
jgi:hypothetical protein